MSSDHCERGCELIGYRSYQTKAAQYKQGGVTH